MVYQTWKKCSILLLIKAMQIKTTTFHAFQISWSFKMIIGILTQVWQNGYVLNIADQSVN